MRATLARSLSAPYPPVGGTTLDPWQWEAPAEELLAEELYQQAMRVEAYILALLQRYAALQRSPDTPHAASGPNSTPPQSPEDRLLDPALQAQADLSTHQDWARDLLEEEEEEAPSLEDGYPQSGSQSLTGSPASPPTSTDPNRGPEAAEAPPPHSCIHPHLQTITHNHSWVSARFIPGRAWHGPVHAPGPFSPAGSRSAGDERAHSKPRSAKRSPNERQRAKKSSSKSSRSQSETSLLGPPAPPHRRHSSQGTGPQPAHGAARRWRSDLELSQDEGESLPAHVHRRQQRKARSAHATSTHDRCQHLHQRLRPHLQERAPLCQEEDSYAAGAPAESESSTSEVYSPASSSLSSDSDESGGLVWPQQLPPRFASTSSSSSSPSPQTAANAASPPKAFVKIKASHALKRKILRFRSGSLKVMTTV